VKNLKNNPQICVKKYEDHAPLREVIRFNFASFRRFHTRAKVTECMVGAAPAKLGISEFISTIGDWPADMDTAALGSGNVSRYCSGFDNYDPVVGSFQFNVNEAAIYPTLGQIQPQLTPTVTSVTTIAWRCSRGATPAGALKARHGPVLRSRD